MMSLFEDLVKQTDDVSRFCTMPLFELYGRRAKNNGTIRIDLGEGELIENKNLCPFDGFGTSYNVLEIFRVMVILRSPSDRISANGHTIRIDDRRGKSVDG
jgi:hypothetical protein